MEPATTRRYVLPARGLLWCLCLGLLLPTAAGADALTGRQIMQESVQRHDYYPYTFERQSMILQDKAGNRDVRRLRRYSRLEEDGTMRFLLVFDEPAEIRGVTLLATRHPDGRISNGIYLPAFGKQWKRSLGEPRNTPFLGTDFTIQDLAPEIPDDYRYQREKDRKIGKYRYYVISALPVSPGIAHATGYGRRRLFVRQDNLFVARTDFYDQEGYLFKRCTRHDLKKVDGKMWRADMILMKDFRQQHLSLLKIDQRVFSRDYVPRQMFEPGHILANGQMAGPAAEKAPSGVETGGIGKAAADLLDEGMNQTPAD